SLPLRFCPLLRFSLASRLAALGGRLWHRLTTACSIAAFGGDAAFGSGSRVLKILFELRAWLTPTLCRAKKMPAFAKEAQSLCGVLRPPVVPPRRAPHLAQATPRQQQLILFDFEGLPGVPHAAGSSCSSASSGREVSRPCSLSLIVVMMVRYGSPRQVLAATGSSKRALRLAAPPEDEVQLDLFLRLQEDWASLTSSCGQTMRLSESGTANLPMAKTIPAQLFTLPKPAAWAALN
ncbi:unnamed protein product, partial [Effrenium voratum]